MPRDEYREWLDESVREMRTLGAAVDGLFAPHEIDGRTYPNSAAAILRIAASIAANIGECVATLRDEQRDDAVFPRPRLVLERELGWRPWEWRCACAGRGQLLLCRDIRAWSISLEREACANGVPWSEAERIGEGEEGRLAEAWDQLCAERDWLEPAQKGLWSADGPDAHNWTWERWAPEGARLLRLVQQLTELALRLLRVEVQRIGTPAAFPRDVGERTGNPSAAPWSNDERADETQISKADFKAKQRRYSGEIEPRSPEDFPSIRGSATGGKKKPTAITGPFRGSGYNERLEAAIHGPNPAMRERSIAATMPHVYYLKHRSPAAFKWGGWAEPRSEVAPAPEDSAADYGDALSVSEVRRAYEATAFANSLGRVMNAGLTLSWFMLPDADIEVQKEADARFRRKLTEWFRSRRELPSSERKALFVYVQENPGGDRFHTHMLLHVPGALIEPFRAYVPAAVAQTAKKVAGLVRERVPEKLHLARVRRHDRHALYSQWIGYHYVTKGADPAALLTDAGAETHTLWSITRFDYRDPGPAVTDDRVRASDALGPAARARAGFVSAMEEQVRTGTVDVRVLFSDRYLRRFNGEPIEEPQPPPPGAGSPLRLGPPRMADEAQQRVLQRRVGRLI